MWQIEQRKCTQIPESLGILHQDVYNAIRRRMEKIARLHPDGDTSLRAWKKRLEGKGYKAIYAPVSAQATGENTYIFGWVSPWQQKVCFLHFLIGYRFHRIYHV